MIAVSDSPQSGYVLAVNAEREYAEHVATIGENVVRIRTALGIKTQTEFARKLGVPQSRAADLEKDRYEFPELKTLIRAAKVCGCSIDEFLAGKDTDYDRVAHRGQAVVKAPTLSDEDRALLALAKNEKARQQVMTFLRWPDQFRAAVIQLLPDSGHQEQESQHGSPPAGQAAGGETRRKHGRARSGAGGKRQ